MTRDAKPQAEPGADGRVIDSVAASTSAIVLEDDPVRPSGSGHPSRATVVGQLSRAARQATPKRRLWVGWTIFAAAFVLFVIFVGVPYSEDDVLLWLTAALFVATLGNPAKWRRGVIRDWLPLYAVLAVYALLRGYASHVLWGPFVRPQVFFDKLIGGGVVPTVTLQHWLFDPHDLRPWDYLVWFTYMSHFFTSFIVAGVLWKRDHARFRRFVPIFVGLTFLGYLTYVLYPAMPPWLASQTGHIAPITRIIPVVWNHVGVHGAAAVFTGGNKFDNNIAAMPSLHAAYPMLLLLFFWKRARRPLRTVLVVYVLAMAFTLVYTGEHFVIDEVVGWTYAVVAFMVGSRLLDRWAAWRSRPPRTQSTAPVDAERGATDPADVVVGISPPASS